MCESEYVYSILKNSTLDAKNKLLRVHNDEVVYYKALFNDEKSIFKKIYYFYEMLAFKYNKKISIHLSINFCLYLKMNVIKSPKGYGYQVISL